ncbi:hypothetical protein Q7P37_002354 [Cladosporium fusiforme]
MRFLTMFFALLALIVFANAEANHVVCYKRDARITQAINRFCGWTWDLTVPSTKASIGGKSKDGVVSVKIAGNCSPKQWVPRNFCIDQFNAICAASFRRGGNGTGRKNYGKKGCQQWTIGKR